jgi:Zn-dependent protease
MAIMYSYNDLRDKVKRYFAFSKDEIKAIVISIIAYAFIISFRQWGDQSFELFAGMGNFFLALIIMTVTLLLHVSVQRISGLNVGFRVEYKLWIYGVIISLIACLFSNGIIWFLFLPGGIFLHLLSTHRLGYFRYGLNMMAHAMVAVVGPLSNLIFAVILKVIQSFLPPSPILQKMILVNVFFAVFTMLPIPPLDGSRVFFQSRMGYAFLLGLIIGIAIFINLNISIFLIIIGSILMAVLLWFLYYTGFERKFWTS